LVTAETGNFHEADAQLHMAQPPMSVSIRKLEQDMGELLFERTSLGVFLTLAGSPTPMTLGPLAADNTSY
jgi:DNA-binding transcriptional LysR family regulator